ncbi:MAG: GNAT family N-acetyltransferase [Mycobacteriales bacterium]
MLVRRYDAGDRQAVIGLASRLTVGVAPWRDPAGIRAAVEAWVTEGVDRADPATRPVFVAEIDGQVAGFVTAIERKHWTGESDAYVSELVVAEGWARKGVGTALLGAAESWAAEAGYRRLTLSTGAANRTARAFYAALGFEEEDITLSRPAPRPEQHEVGRPSPRLSPGIGTASEARADADGPDRVSRRTDG